MIANEPVVVGDTIVALLIALGSVAMAMGWVEWDEEQIASLKNLVLVAVPVVIYVGGSLWKRSRVRPIRGETE